MSAVDLVLMNSMLLPVSTFGLRFPSVAATYSDTVIDPQRFRTYSDCPDNRLDEKKRKRWALSTMLAGCQRVADVGPIFQSTLS